jgi:hypothetical protein
MDEQSGQQANQQPQKREMTDAEVISQVKQKIDKSHAYLDSKQITLGWRIVFCFVILCNIISLLSFLIFLRASLFPSPADLIFLVGLPLMIIFAVFVLLINIVVSLLFLRVKKPNGGTRDFFFRCIYISIIIYLLPTIIFFMFYRNILDIGLSIFLKHN